METGSFSYHLKTAMESAELKSKGLEDLLVQSGITNITWRRIGEYLRQETTPDPEKARQIFDVLGYEISDEQILDSLQMNREEIRNSKEMITTFNRREITVRVRYSNIKLKNKVYTNSERETKSSTELLIQDRLEKLYGKSEGMMTTYVQELIGKDLDSFILKGESRETR